MSFDVAVVGVGRIGLATARGLMRRYPNGHMGIGGKEGDIASHQSCRNSRDIDRTFVPTPAV